MNIVVAVIAIVVTIVIATSTAWCSLYRSVGTVEGKVDTINSRFGDFGKNVDTLTAQGTRFDERLRDLETLTNNLRTSVSELARLQQLLNELQAEHKTVQSSVDVIRDRVAPEGGEPLPVGFYQDVTSRLRRVEQRLDDVASKLGAAPRPGGN